MLSGGQSKAVFYRVSDTGTAYAIKQLDGATDATTDADASLTLLNEIENTQINPQEDGTLQVVWDNYQDDDALNTFLNTVAMPAASSSRLQEWYNEKGVKKGGSSSDNLVLVIIYGAYDSANDKYKMHYVLGVISPTSGSTNQASDQYSKPSLQLDGRHGDYSLTIPVGLQDDAILTAAEQVIASSYCYKRLFQAASA